MANNLSLDDLEGGYQKDLSAASLEKDYMGPSLEERKTAPPPQPQQNIFQRGYNFLGGLGDQAGNAVSNTLGFGPKMRETSKDFFKFFTQDVPMTVAPTLLTGGMGKLAEGAAKVAKAGPLLTGGLVKGAQFAGNVLGGAGQAAATGGSPAEGALIAGGLHAGTEGIAGLRAGIGKLIAGRQALKNYEAKKAYDESFHTALDQLEQQGHAQEVAKLRSQYNEAIRQTRAANQSDKTAYQNTVQGIRDQDAKRIRQEKIDYQAKIAADEAAYNAKNQQDATAYAAQKAAHANDAAASLAEDFKAAHPALKDLPSTYEGLTNMVYGKGQSLVSEAFDKSLQEVVKKGAGKPVTLTVDDAKALGFKNMRGQRYQIAPSGRGLEPEVKVDVDAGELAQRLPGFWKKNPQVYRRGVGALDEAGIGDPAAREQYSKFQGLVDFLDRNKALTPTGLNTKNIEKGLYDLKKVNVLRKRGIGDVLEGPMQVARGGPLAPHKPAPFEAPPFIAGPRTPLPPAPAPRAMPPRPEMPMKPNRLPPSPPQDPRSQFMGPATGGAIGGLLGYLGGAAMGHPYIGAHVGAAMGAPAGRVLAPQGIPVGNLDPALAEYLMRNPGLISAIARQRIQGPQGPQGSPQ